MYKALMSACKQLGDPGEDQPKPNRSPKVHACHKFLSQMTSDRGFCVGHRSGIELPLNSRGKVISSPFELKTHARMSFALHGIWSFVYPCDLQVQGFSRYLSVSHALEVL